LIHDEWLRGIIPVFLTAPSARSAPNEQNSGCRLLFTRLGIEQSTAGANEAVDALGSLQRWRSAAQWHSTFEGPG
jgi:hypothetical protein